MFEKLDLRGLLCPEPVIATKKVLDNAETELVEAFVDDEICVANLERLARFLKASCIVEPQEGFFRVIISKSGRQIGEPPTLTQTERLNDPDNKVRSVVFITKDRLGDGDPEFSKTLADVFLQTLYEAEHRPRAILMANTGVKLMQAGSATRKVLRDFSAAGCDVLACGLCVEYYGLKQDVNKEQITNMFAICEYLTAAEKILQF